MLTHGSLFAGIGGFDLGFERAGIKTVWQVEIDEYCRRVLARHFPDAYQCTDIRECSGMSGGTTYFQEGKWKRRTQYLSPVDILSGGFPCQDISNAGKRAGIDGERSGLWREYARIICELRPRIVVVENVAALLGRGMGRVLGDLAEIGYDAEWQSIRASDVGAPHRRERIWIVAYAQCAERWPSAERRHESNGHDSGRKEAASRVAQYSEDVADATRQRCREAWSDCERHSQWTAGGCDALAYTSSERLSVRFNSTLGTAAGNEEFERLRSAGQSWWATEPDVGRVAHGIPARVDRLRGLGNAVVPQIAEWIGRRIVEFAAPWEGVKEEENEREAKTHSEKADSRLDNAIEHNLCGQANDLG